MSEDPLLGVGLPSLFGGDEVDDVYVVPQRRELSRHEIEDAERTQVDRAFVPSLARVLTSWAEAPCPSSHVYVAPGDAASLRIMLAHEWAAGHPEQPSRLERIFQDLHTDLWQQEGAPKWQLVDGRDVRKDELLMVHSPVFVEELWRLCYEAPSTALWDALTTVENLTAARFPRLAAAATLRAAGSALALCERIVAAPPFSVPAVGFALVRPAGHHSRSNKTGSFCGINVAALAAAWIVHSKPDARVLVVDIDAHRSGGTEEIVTRLHASTDGRCSVVDLFMSLGARDSDHPPGVACHPLPEGVDDDAYLSVLRTSLTAATREAAFCPSHVVVSAGYDTAAADKEGGRISTPGFSGMVGTILDLGLHTVVVLEGGYAEGALAAGVVASVRTALQRHVPAAVC